MTIGIFTHPQAPALDFYRSSGVLAYTDNTLRYLSVTESQWYDLIDCDVIFFKSPNSQTYVDLVETAKAMGKPILMDYDDNMHSTTPCNPAHKVLGSIENQDTVKRCMELADHIIFSTKALQDFYTAMFPKIETSVVPNAWNPLIQKWAAMPEKGDKWKIAWRGAAHHLDDIRTIEPQLTRLSVDKDFELTFVGLTDWISKHLYPNAEVLDFEPNLFKYFHKYINLGHHYGICPLVPNEFNLGKSNIFVIETLCAGAITIAPVGFPEFDIPGVIQFSDLDHLDDIIESIRKDEIDREKIITEGRQYMNEHLRIDKVNAKRIEILNKLKLY